MKALSVIELSKLYGMNRQSIYKRINKGDLSKNSDGKIDLAEAIRVFGEPAQRTTQNVTLQSQATQKSAEVDMLRQTVDMLQRQLQLAEEREAFQREELKAKNEQIYSLQLLLGAPKPSATRSEDGHHSVKSEDESVKEKPISTMPEIKVTESIQPVETKRRSLLGRLWNTIIE